VLKLKLRRILDRSFRCLIFLLVLNTSSEEILKHLVSQTSDRESVITPSSCLIIRKLRINFIRKLPRDMRRQISPTLCYELRDVAISIRETIAGESVTVVREVFLRESDETVLDKIDSSHFVFLRSLTYIYIITQIKKDVNPILTNSHLFLYQPQPTQQSSLSLVFRWS
jgi:hypothetical protein